VSRFIWSSSGTTIYNTERYASCPTGSWKYHHSHAIP